MARINIEDSLYRDLRFLELCRKTSSVDEAIGCLVRAWTLAQKWFLSNDGKIPLKEWEDQRLPNALIECGLAKIIDGMVWMAGAEEQFSWLKQKSIAGKSNRKKTVKEDERALTYVDGRRAPTPTLSLPHTLTQTLTLSQNTITTTRQCTVADETAPVPVVARRPSNSSLIKFENENALLGSIRHDLRSRWDKLYPDPEFINRELTKAFGWYSNNPIKMPKTMKGWNQALSSWFERSWTSHVKTIKSAKPDPFAFLKNKPVESVNEEEAYD